MKKYIFILITLFLLTGCESKLEYSFGDNIKSDITVNFTLNEYKNYTNMYYGNDFNLEDDSVIKESIEQQRNLKAFSHTYSNTYHENYFRENNNYYEASYTYNYTYKNFNNNNVLDYCFEVFNTSEDDTAYYYNLSGESYCSGTKLVINANNRMINSNSKNVIGDKYTWIINKDNNDIYFAISKTPIKTTVISTTNIIYLIIAFILGIVTYLLNRKYKKK